LCTTVGGLAAVEIGAAGEDIGFVVIDKREEVGFGAVICGGRRHALGTQDQPVEVGIVLRGVGRPARDHRSRIACHGWNRVLPPANVQTGEPEKLTDET
jgi:hypothetical protein